MSVIAQELFHNSSDKERIVFDLYEIRHSVDQSPTPSEGWERFFAKHPEYIQFDELLARAFARKGRDALEESELSEELINELGAIGGAVMRAHLDNETITEIGKDGR